MSWGNAFFGERRLRVGWLALARRTGGWSVRFDRPLVPVPERLVDVEQGTLLALGQLGVGPYGQLDRQVVVVAWVEDPRPHVQRLGRDAQALRELLQHLGRGFAHPPLDLAQVRVGYPCLVRE